MLTVEEIDRLTCVIKEFTTEITAANPFENAQICCGGADVREIAPESMESKLKKGLYPVSYTHLMETEIEAQGETQGEQPADEHN